MPIIILMCHKVNYETDTAKVVFFKLYQNVSLSAVKLLSSYLLL